MKSGCKSCWQWIQISDRWLAAVDYGSPVTAWTPRMRELLIKHNGDKNAAMREEREYRKHER